MIQNAPRNCRSSSLDKLVSTSLKGLGRHVDEVGPVDGSLRLVFLLGVRQIRFNHDVDEEALAKFGLGFEEAVPSKKRQVFKDDLIVRLGCGRRNLLWISRISRGCKSVGATGS